MTEPATYDLSSREGYLHRIADTTSRRIPPAFRKAQASDPAVLAWCDAAGDGGTRSLLIIGPTGVGKTWQAFGAIRQLASYGIPVRWEAVTAPDLYGRLRPRDGSDPEAELARLSRVALLLIDDIGAAKASDWTEEINYRLVGYRHDHELPLILTSNLPATAPDGQPCLAAALGERVMSRVTGMCDYAVLKGADRRRKLR